MSSTIRSFPATGAMGGIARSDLRGAILLTESAFSSRTIGGRHHHRRAPAGARLLNDEPYLAIVLRIDRRTIIGWPPLALCVSKHGGHVRRSPLSRLRILPRMSIHL